MSYNYDPIRQYNGTAANPMKAAKPSKAGVTTGRSSQYATPSVRQTFTQNNRQPVQSVAGQFSSGMPAGQQIHSVSPQSPRGLMASAIGSQSKNQYQSPQAWYNPRTIGQSMLLGRYGISGLPRPLPPPHGDRQPAHTVGGQAYVSPNMGSFGQGFQGTVSRLGKSVLDNHELEHATQQRGMTKSPVTKENAETGPVIGDIVFGAEQFSRENGRPLRHTVNLPGGVSHDADWMARQAGQHGYFDGGAMHDLIFNTPEGRQWYQRMSSSGQGIAPPASQSPRSMMDMMDAEGPISLRDQPSQPVVPQEMNDFPLRQSDVPRQATEPQPLSREMSIPKRGTQPPAGDYGIGGQQPSVAHWDRQLGSMRERQAQAMATARSAFQDRMQAASDSGVATAQAMAGFAPGQLDARSAMAEQRFTSPYGYTDPQTGRVTRNGVLMGNGRLGGSYPMTNAERGDLAAETNRQLEINRPAQLSPQLTNEFINAGRINFENQDLSGADADAIMNGRFQRRLADRDSRSKTPQSRHDLLVEDMEKRRAIRGGLYNPNQNGLGDNVGYWENNPAIGDENQMPRFQASEDLRMERADMLAGVNSNDRLRAGRAGRYAMKQQERAMQRDANARNIFLNQIAMRNPSAAARLVNSDIQARGMMNAEQARNQAKLEGIKLENQGRAAIAADDREARTQEFNARSVADQQRHDQMVQQSTQQHEERMRQLEINAAGPLELERERNRFAKEQADLERSNPVRVAQDAATIAAAEAAAIGSKVDGQNSQRRLDGGAGNPIADYDDAIKAGATPDEARAAAAGNNPGVAIPVFSIQGFDYGDAHPTTNVGIERMIGTTLDAYGFGQGEGRSKYEDFSDGAMSDDEARFVRGRYYESGGTEDALRREKNRIEQEMASLGSDKTGTGQLPLHVRHRVLSKMLGEPAADYDKMQREYEQRMQEANADSIHQMYSSPRW